jgi:3-phenylpropionate/trans-cinnamate dioxygenase ferredoxin reductase subunit
MAEAPDTVVVVGAGQAAAVAARTLRRRGHGGPIVLLGDEKHRPYQRPPLSKEYLAGEQERDECFLLDEQWCVDNDVDVRLGTAVDRIDPRSAGVELVDGSIVAADVVLLATGARARRIPGVEGERIVYLRGLDDAEQLRHHLAPGRRIITVGGGFIGSEVASAGRAAGADVVVIEALDVPYERVLGPEMGGVCARIQRDHGVRLLTGHGVESVEERADGVTVRTNRGEVVEGDVVVVGIGTVANTEVAQRSGIAVDGGVLVDEYCRTDLDRVLAAGDVTNHWHPLFGRRLRVEHFDNANKQAMCAAKNIVGRATAYDDPHWFWSDQFGLNLQYSGHAATWTDLVVRGDVDSLCFTAFYLDGGVVRAALSVDRGEDVFPSKSLIAQQARPDPAALRDEDVDLVDLAAG